MKKVYITGVGPVCKIGVGRINLDFETQVLVEEITAYEIPDNANQWAVEMYDFNPDEHLKEVQSYIDRTSALALVSAQLALKDANETATDENPIGLCYGSSWGCLDSVELFLDKHSTNPKFVPPLVFSHAYPNSPSSIIAITHKLRSHACTFAGGVLAGSKAILNAFDTIRANTCDIILAGGSDTTSHLVYKYLLQTNALSKTKDLNSTEKGIIPGEGAGLVVLSSKKKGNVELKSVEYSAGKNAVEHLLESVKNANEIPTVIHSSTPETIKSIKGEIKKNIPQAKTFSLYSKLGEVFSARAGLMLAIALSHTSSGDVLVLDVDSSGAIAMLIGE